MSKLCAAPDAITLADLGDLEQSRPQPPERRRKLTLSGQKERGRERGGSLLAITLSIGVCRVLIAIRCSVRPKVRSEDKCGKKSN